MPQTIICIISFTAKSATNQMRFSVVSLQHHKSTHCLLVPVSIFKPTCTVAIRFALSTILGQFFQHPACSSLKCFNRLQIIAPLQFGTERVSQRTFATFEWCGPVHVHVLMALVRLRLDWTKYNLTCYEYLTYFK